MLSKLWRLAKALLWSTFGLALPIPAIAQSSITLIEYYHAGFDHYFITGIAEEIAKLDNGTLVGWTRTGQQFGAYALGSAGTSAACRFFSTAFGTKSSHFYTPYAFECFAVQANPNWQFEAEVFGVRLPDTAGNCPAGTVRLYRLYNNGQGGAPNHRYTVDLTIRATMIGRGWIPEGAGSIGVIACIPAPAPATAEGMWLGTTNTAETVIGFVLDNNVFYFLYTTPHASTIGGVVQGTGVLSGGSSFSSSNAKDFSFSGQGIYNASIVGNFTPRSTITGAIASALGVVSYSLVYQAIYEQPASLLLTAGTYAGTAATSLGSQPVLLSISTAGAITGSASGCSFAGTATPRGSVNVFNVSIRFNGGLCQFGTATLTGIGYFDAATRTIYSVAPNSSRTDGFLFVGTKP